MRVNGDSMLGAGIVSRFISCNRSLEVTNNCIVVAHIDGEFTVKRIKKIKTKMFLQVENESYKPIEITKKWTLSYLGSTHAIHHFV